MSYHGLTPKPDSQSPSLLWHTGSEVEEVKKAKTPHIELSLLRSLRSHGTLWNHSLRRIGSRTTRNRTKTFKVRSVGWEAHRTSHHKMTLHLLSYLNVPGHAAGLERLTKSVEIESGNYDQSGNIMEFSINIYWRKEGRRKQWEQAAMVASWERAGNEQGTLGSGYCVYTKNLGVLS